MTMAHTHTHTLTHTHVHTHTRIHTYSLLPFLLRSLSVSLSPFHTYILSHAHTPFRFPCTYEHRRLTSGAFCRALHARSPGRVHQYRRKRNYF